MRIRIFNSAAELAAWHRDAMMGRIVALFRNSEYVGAPRMEAVKELITTFGDDENVHKFLMDTTNSLSHNDSYPAACFLLEQIAIIAHECKSSSIALGEASRPELETLQSLCANQWLNFINKEYAEGGKSNEELAETALRLASCNSHQMREVALDVLRQTTIPRQGLAQAINNVHRHGFSEPKY